MTVPNVVFACAQVALLVTICAPLPRLLRLRSPAVHYVFWRVLLAVCLVLPFVQPHRPAEMVFVPAPAGAALPSPGTDAAPAGPAPAAPAPIDWWKIAGLTIAAGSAFRLMWIAAGLVRLRRMRRHAGEPAAGFDDLSRTIGVAAPILWSRDVTHPVTFGFLRPVVLLPVALKSVDAPAQRAVVAHELHHVKRRDWLWIVTEEIVRSLVWFHPAVWWLISRVQLARETVVDELSILTTNARRAYLDTLLAFADDTGLQSTPAFSARRHLFHRVMLLSREEGMSSIRIAAASSVLAIALAAGSLGAVQAFPLYASAQLPPAPPRDPLSPAAYHRLAAEYARAALEDPSVADDRKLELILKGIAAEDRALELRPEYPDALLLKAILVRRQSELTPDLSERARLVLEANALSRNAMALGRAGSGPDGNRTMPPPSPSGISGGVPGGVPGGVAGGEPGGVPREPEMLFMPESFARQMNELKPLRIDGGAILPPMKVWDVKPVYPPIAQQAGVRGVVIMEAIIDADGNVAAVRILRSIPLLDRAALDAVQQWKFESPRVNGMPQPLLMTVTVNFNVH